MLCQTFTNIFKKEMAIEDPKIHQNRERNNQNRPTLFSMSMTEKFFHMIRLTKKHVKFILYQI